MKGRGLLIALSLSNIAFALAFGYTFYCERRSTTMLKQIKKDAPSTPIRAEYKEYWATLQPA